MEDEKTALAGELALGLLEGEERRHALRQVARDPELRAAMQFWNARLSTLCDEDEVPEVAPPARVQRAIEALPSNWLAALRAARGIYLLTCPRTKEQYVGSAYGEDGFLGRWTGYARDGHGGNIGLKSRELSDYQVSILEVCGSGLTVDEIIRVEALWKAKLQSREMGLNKN